MGERREQMRSSMQRYRDFIFNHNFIQESNQLDALVSLVTRMPGYRERFVSQVVDLFCIIARFDPFSIYKARNGREKKAHYRIYLSDELRLSEGNETARAFMRGALFAFSYIIAKFVLLNVAQILLYILINSSACTTRRSELCLWSVRQLTSLESLLGNPLAPLTGVAIAIYTYFTYVILYSFIIKPHMYKQEPADAPNLRFFMKPSHELSRTGILIREQMDEFFQSTILFQSKTQRKQNTQARSDLWPSSQSGGNQLHLSLCCHCPVCESSLLNKFSREYNSSRSSQHERDADVWALRFLEQQRRLVLDIQQQEATKLTQLVQSMRPPVYNFVWYEIMSKTAFIAMILGSPTETSSVVYILIWFFRKVVENRCKASNITPCSAQTVFTWPDLISFAEFSLGCLFCGFFIVLQIALVLYNGACQFVGMEIMKQELVRVLNDIEVDNLVRNHNSLSVARELAAGSKEFKDSCDAYYDGTPRDWSDNSTDPGSLMQHQVRYDHLDVVMLRLFIKLKLTMNENARNGKFLSELLEALISSIGLPVILVILTENMKGTDLREAREHLFNVSLFVLNLVLIGVAFIYAKALAVERVVWSILAHNSLRIQRKRPLTLEGDLISAGWRRLVQNDSLNDKRNSTHPFGMSITFERVLGLNFFVVSLAVLLNPLK